MNPGYDAYLNFLKNQTPDPDLPPVAQLKAEDIRRDDNLPDDLRAGNHADYATELADLKEGDIVGLVGYLYYWQESGKETTNCGWTRKPDNVDYHIGIGFNPSLARSLLSTPIQRPSPRQQQPDWIQTAVIVEMTPHYRAKYHAKWTQGANALFGKYRGRQVKVIGQLLVDNEHINGGGSCSSPDANHVSCWRASVWEIHPVTQFYVCRTASPCAWDSTAWARIDDQP